MDERRPPPGSAHPALGTAQLEPVGRRAHQGDRLRRRVPGRPGRPNGLLGVAEPEPGVGRRGHQRVGAAAGEQRSEADPGDGGGDAAQNRSGPPGRVGSRAERAVLAVVGLGGVAALVVPAGPVAVVAVSVVVLATAAGVGLRFERSRDLDRERILRVLWGVGTAGLVAGHVGFVGVAAPPGTARAVLTALAVVTGLAVPIALGVAAVAPRIADVRRVISGTVSAVVMVDLALGLYVGALSAIEVVTGSPPARVAESLTAVILAAVFHPAFVAVRRTLDQVLFGGRPDPVGVVARLGDELRRGGGPQQWLDALRTAATLPGVAVRDGGGVLATSGTVDDPSTTTALLAGDDHVGDLVVALPEHHRELPRPTDAVLRIVAGPLARALQSARLAEEVARSRRRVVLAAEEERRRLRRDLHDGLGPVLAGVAYTADAARNLLDDHPGTTAALLGQLRADITDAIDEVRRIVHDLRPPVLDQLGLLPAICQQAARISTDAAGPSVSVDAEASATTELPAAVEVAAYRMVTEAVLTVVRHADARTAHVTIRRVDAEIEVEVVDDGPTRVAWEPGVGLSSMRERLEQLGGVLQAGPVAHGPRPRTAGPTRRGPGRWVDDQDATGQRQGLSPRPRGVVSRVSGRRWPLLAGPARW